MKKLFIVIAGIFLSVNYAKAADTWFDYWHGCAIPGLTDAQKYEALVGAVKNDRTIIDEYFTKGIVDPHDIYMTQLTLCHGDDPVKGYISEETALQMLSEGAIDSVTNFWDGSWLSARYAADGKSGSVFDPGNPQKGDPVEDVEMDEIFVWKGIPLVRWRCLNPVVANGTPEPKEQPLKEQPKEPNTYVPPRMGAATLSNPGGITIVNNNQNINRNTPQVSGDQRQRGSGVLPAIIGAIGGYALGRMTGNNQYIPQRTNYGRGQQYYQPRQRNPRQRGPYSGPVYHIPGRWPT